MFPASRGLRVHKVIQDRDAIPYFGPIAGAPKRPRPVASDKLSKTLQDVRAHAEHMAENPELAALEQEEMNKFIENMDMYQSPKIARARQNMVNWWSTVIPSFLGKNPKDVSEEELWRVDTVAAHAVPFLYYRVTLRSLY